MVRIGISVEGLTEERFVKTVLCLYLADMQIYITAVSMDGVVNIDKVRNEVKKIAFSFDYVTTLYDFYGFSRKEEGVTKESLQRRLVDAMHETIRERFIPYVQMYEFEGLLFSSPEVIAIALNQEQLNEWAAEILNEFNHNPESINNSVETAPSKRLEYNPTYRKSTHGPDIAKEIGLK